MFLFSISPDFSFLSCFLPLPSLETLLKSFFRRIFENITYLFSRSYKKSIFFSLSLSIHYPSNSRLLASFDSSTLSLYFSHLQIRTGPSHNYPGVSLYLRLILNWKLACA